VAAINDSGKKIVGLGEGGYAFFGKLGLNIGYDHGWHGSENGMIVVDSSNDVFKTPNNLGVTTGQTISIYTSTGNVGIYLPSPPTNIVLLGREVGSSDHYTLLIENSRYLLWGWTASPDSMTQTGKGLFENIISDFRFSVAYIYQTDTASANSFKNFLEGKGYSTSLIHIDSIVSGMFANYSLILIGSDTGYTSTWGNSEKVAAINDSGKQIVGLGEGGYAFFGKLGLNIGYPWGWHGSENHMVVVDSSNDVFKTPNNLGVTTGQTLTIYDSTGNVGITPPSLENIILLGREVDPEHYTLLIENNRYLLWGWTASPDSMTEIGKSLFENIIAR
jgi:hypothetical protein